MPTRNSKASSATGVGKVLICGLLVLVAGCGKSGPPPATLSITTTPDSGVLVKVNGKARGATPLTISDLKHGRAYVEVADPAYKQTGQLVDIPETGEVHVELKLKPRVGYVSFESDPPYSEVVLKTKKGEKVLGTTPLTKTPIPVGKQTWILRHANYEDLTDSQKVEEDYVYTKTYKLTPQKAHLQVTSMPPDCNIWLNDQEQVRKTPSEFELIPGTYRVLVHTKGYLSNEDIIDLGPGEQRELNFKLMKGNAPPGMVLVPAGEFILGVDGASPDESPQQKVYLPAFYIDRYEVTNRQWAAVFPNHSYQEGQANFPVTGITWREAEAYAKAVGKRLPTEMEWEKAARGTDGREYPWGNTFDSSKCNTSEQRDPGLRAVGSFKAGASPYGCYDMAGNAYEWTSSWYQPYEGNKVITKEYGQVYRVLRGGSFRTGSFDCRCARRYFDNMDHARNDYGLRLAADVEQSDKGLEPEK